MKRHNTILYIGLLPLLFCGFFASPNFTLNSNKESIAAAKDTIFWDKRIPLDSVGNGLPPFTITESGSYFLTQNILLTTSSVDGIVIEASNVTIDLNGFTVSTADGVDGRIGIHVIGNKSQISIENGTVSGWLNRGIDAPNADQSTFQDLRIQGNSGGLSAGDDCSFTNCVVSENEGAGIVAGLNAIITACNASSNSGNGFFTDEGAVITNCNAYDNKDDGFVVGSKSRIEGCTAHRNEEHGFVGGLAVHFNRCNANENGGNGFTLVGASFLMNSKASKNGYCIDDTNCSTRPFGNSVNDYNFFGNGARIIDDCKVINCTFAGNVRTGLRILNQGNYIANNYFVNNINTGIYATNVSSLFLGNICKNNGIAPSPDYLDGGMLVSGNYVIEANNSFGPIINVNGTGDISAVAGANHPFANFEY